MKKKIIIAIATVVVVFVLIFSIVGGLALLPLVELFSKEKLSIGDIQVMASEGSIDVAYQDNGTIQWIDGTFTDIVVESKKDAVKVLEQASELLGETFSVTEDYISHQTAEDDSASAEHFYRYAPIVNGISVVGSQTILSTDNEGKVTGLFSTYDDGIYNINTDPDISEEEALDKAWEALLSNEEIDTFLNQYVSDNLSKSDVIAEFKNSMATNIELQIYAAAEESSPLLVYAVSVYSQVDSPAIIDNDGNDVYNDSPINIESENDPERVSADFSMIDVTYYFLASGDNAGELHHMSNNIQGWDTVQLTAKDQTGKTRYFYAQTKDGKFRLRDATRNLETYKTTYGNILWVEPKLPGKMVEFTTTMSSVAVSAHANMSVVYDYYLNVLGRKSFDGKGKKVIVSYDYDKCRLLGLFSYSGAAWKDQEQQFVFGSEGNFASALDAVAHEFTHAVSDYIVGDGHEGLIYYGESGALNEAYSDIMGCLIEGKSGEGLWLCGEDSDEAIRSMKDPHAYDQPEHYKDRYTGGNDHGGVHTNSGIFNHAAYKMITDKRTAGIELTTWAKVFYRSLFRLTGDATFSDARGAIISSAKNLGFSSEQIKAIKEAFDSVGIWAGKNENTTSDTNTSKPTENNESAPNANTSKPAENNESTPDTNTSTPTENSGSTPSNPTNPSDPSVPSTELNVGDHIYFGSAKPGEDPDIWQVINVEGDYALIYNMCMYQGVFDASIHAQTNTINLMRYHTYGSVSWEHSNLRSWLNSRDDEVVYQDVIFDYSDTGIATIPWDSNDSPTYTFSSGYLNEERFTKEEYYLIQPVIHKNLISWPESGMDSVMDVKFGKFSDDLSQFYKEPYGVSTTTDMMFPLSGLEYKEYVLDNNLWGSYYPNGKAFAAFWLRDSVDTDFAGFYGYYGTHALTVSNGKASSNQADLSSSIRPACYIDTKYIQSLSGTGEFESPYKLTIDPNVKERTKQPFEDPINELNLESSNGLLITEHGDHCSVDGIGTCTLSNLIIPSEYNGLPVTIISDEAFLECTNLTSVTIPDSVTEIGDSAFLWCTSLISVNIPNSVVKIADCAFQSCTSLPTITIPDSVTYLGDAVFYNCKKLKDVKLSNNMAQILPLSFTYCSSLTCITIPKSVTHIGFSAFSGCSNLHEIVFEGTIEEWNSIPKDNEAYPWNKNVPANTVICKDGNVDLS